MNIETEALTRLWGERWPGCSKLPYELRRSPDRWVRFHTLPASKRHPETAAEYSTVLGRHNTILAELAGDSPVLVMTAGYSDRPEPRGPVRYAVTEAVHPGASYWSSVRINGDPGFETWMHLYVSRLCWSAGCVDPLLRLVADNVIADVLLADAGLRWLYHPYDGGMDVVTASAVERDALSDGHRDWLPTPPRR